ncbi:MAG: tetratricopeptide repeat protein [Lachnospiraceae bacterium]|jgi:hypothetical protein
MDKQEYREFLEEIRRSHEAGNYERVTAFADQIDLAKIKETKILEIISDSYEQRGNYDMAREALLVAYERNHANIGRQIVYKLSELSIKVDDLDSAVGFYEDFCSVAKNDSKRLLLKYEIGKAGGIPKGELIKVLEAYVSREKDDKWQCELAQLYHETGQVEKCVAMCDDISLWYADGKYVKKALELKFAHCALTPQQQIKYEHMMREYMDEGEMTPVTGKEESEESEKMAEEFYKEYFADTAPLSAPSTALAPETESEFMHPEHARPVHAETTSEIIFEETLDGVPKAEYTVVYPEDYGEDVKDEDGEAFDEENYEEEYFEKLEEDFLPEDSCAPDRRILCGHDSDEIDDTRVIPIDEIRRELDSVAGLDRDNEESGIEESPEDCDMPEGAETFETSREMFAKLAKTFDALEGETGVEAEPEFEAEPEVEPEPENEEDWIERIIAEEAALEEEEFADTRVISRSEILRRMKGSAVPDRMEEEPVVPEFYEDEDREIEETRVLNREMLEALLAENGADVESEPAVPVDEPEELIEEIEEPDEDLEESVEEIEEAEIEFEELTEEIEEAEIEFEEFTEEIEEAEIEFEELTEKIEEPDEDLEEPEEPAGMIGEIQAADKGKKEIFVVPEEIREVRHTEKFAPESSRMSDTGLIAGEIINLPAASAAKLGAVSAAVSAFAPMVVRPAPGRNKAAGRTKTFKGGAERPENVSFLEDVDLSYIPLTGEEGSQLTLNLEFLSAGDENIEGQLSFDEVFDIYSHKVEENMDQVSEVEAERLRQIQNAVNLSAPVVLPYSMDDLYFEGIEVEKIADVTPVESASVLSKESEGKSEAADDAAEILSAEQEGEESSPEESALEDAELTEEFEKEPESIDITGEDEEEPEMSDEELMEVFVPFDEINFDEDEEKEAKTYNGLPVEPRLGDAEKAIAEFEQALREKEISISDDEELDELGDSLAEWMAGDEYAEYDNEEGTEPAADAEKHFEKHPYRYELSDTIRKEIAEYLLIDGMEDMVCDAVSHIVTTIRNGDRTGGNLVITGDAKSGKTYLTISIIKAVTEELKGGNGTVAKVQAGALNGKNLEKVFEKIAGNDLIIENIGYFEDDTINELIRVLSLKRYDSLVALEGNQLAAENIFGNFPELRELIQTRIDINELSIIQWADLAADYAKDRGYILDDMARLALHAKINELNKPTVRLGYNDVMDLMDEAIARAEKRNVGRLFSAFSKKGDNELREIIEVDFM